MEDHEPGEAETLQKLEARLGHRFANSRLALQALTHSSAKDKESPCNERLEFLGDAILGHVISEHLYHHFPGYEEGELSTMKSIIVSASTLSEKAFELGIDDIIILGRGLKEKRNLPKSILANAFEAVIAALYLDAGFEKTREFILNTLRVKVDQILKDEHEKNYKSLLQDYAQRMRATIPVYKVLKEEGPDHRKMFQVVVDLAGTQFGPAWGANKKEAEQRAAKKALQMLGLLSGTPEPEETPS
ncbi:MAG TPA: ribonuclease III [Planctomycetota bacterium]|nr:ribonuclease III [Planctomycetota bacterium]